MRVPLNGMHNYFYHSDPRDRAKSAAATAAIHLALGAAFLTGLALDPQNQHDDGLKIFDVAEPPPPPPPQPPKATNTRASEQQAPAGRKANPSSIVAPPARLPTPQPVAAAPVAGTGSSSSAGAAASGTGLGAGGSGAGAGGGGTAIGSEARLLYGNRARLPRALLRPFAADRGYAHLLLTVADSGRVTGCRVMQSTGSPAVDDALCQVMIRQSQWTAARDTSGRPITVQVRYTSTWSKW